MTRLYHYTCTHGRKALGDLGDVVPAAYLEPALAGGFLSRLAWFTDLATPDRGALGLTMNLTTCDRTRYRYRVTIKPSIAAGLRPWTDVRRLYPRDLVRDLETAPADPAHWWVADRPVPVIYERRGIER